MATGQEVPESIIGDGFFGGFLSDHHKAAPILKDHYGLSSENAFTLAMAGEDACEKVIGNPDPSEITNWPEAEIVQALLDKVDELEAKEAND